MRRVGVVLVGGLYAAFLLFMFVRSRDLDTERHAHTTNRLRELARTETDLERDLERTRNTFDEAGDELGLHVATALQKIDEVSEDAIFDRSGFGPRSIRDARDAFERARVHLESIRADAREWKHHLNRVASLASESLAASDTPPRIGQIVAALLRLNVLRSDEQANEELARALDAAAATGIEADRSIEAEARAAADCQRRIDARFEELRGLELSSKAAALADSYEHGWAEESAVVDFYRVCLYLFSLLLLVRLAQSMHELRKRTRELHLSNSNLEERVDSRTRSLGRVNESLLVEVAERERAEREAQLAREAAESANRTKSDFLANMSHEIRTPMTSIVGYSERLIDADMNESERVEAVGAIRRNGAHLLQLIDDILDLSKIEAGRLELERIACSPIELAAEVRKALGGRAQAKGLDLRLEWRSRVPERIVTDPVRVRQILLNLLGNALKFTERGSVTIAISHRASELGPRLEFVVADTGVGMDAAALARLFRPFTQADSTTTRRFGGTGLGLSITKHLVQLLDGSISVDSTPGIGTTFRVEIQAGLVAGCELVDGAERLGAALLAEVPPAMRIRDLSGLRVLLADDGEDNQRLIAHFLRAAGAEVVVARDGRAAIDRTLDAQHSGRPFDVVLMDIQMPVLDGYEATRKLRAGGYTRPIVALTAHAMASDRERALASGCDDHCAKPVTRERLLTVVAHAAGRETTEKTMETHPLEAKKSRPDDELLQLVTSFVEDLGLDVTAMRAALERGDLEHLSLLAHRLKGAAGSYGFPALTRQAAMLEKSAEAPAAGDAIACELEALSALCTAARIERGIE